MSEPCPVSNIHKTTKMILGLKAILAFEAYLSWWFIRRTTSTAQKA